MAQASSRALLPGAPGESAERFHLLREEDTEYVVWNVPGALKIVLKEEQQSRGTGQITRKFETEPMPRGSSFWVRNPGVLLPSPSSCPFINESTLRSQL